MTEIKNNHQAVLKLQRAKIILKMSQLRQTNLQLLLLHLQD